MTKSQLNLDTPNGRLSGEPVRELQILTDHYLNISRSRRGYVDVSGDRRRITLRR